VTEATLIRSAMRFEREFTQIPNAFMRDNKLTFKARGLLAMLMTHKPGQFKVTLKTLASDNPEGLDALRAAVNELETQGYLRRYRKAKGGQFQPDTWELCDPHDIPRGTPLAALDNPTRGDSAWAEPTRTALDNPTPIRTLEEHSLVTEVPTVRCPSRTRGGHLWTGDRCAYCAIHHDDVEASA
jgi:hypothetical protein